MESPTGISFRDADNGWVTMYYRDNPAIPLWHSRDGGRTTGWALLSDGRDVRRLLATSDGGQTWQEVPVTLPNRAP